MLVGFAAAMAVMGWILLPTLDNVGPTAPVIPTSRIRAADRALSRGGHEDAGQLWLP